MTYPPKVAAVALLKTFPDSLSSLYCKLPLISPHLSGIYQHLLISSLYTGFLRIFTVIYVNGDIHHPTSGDFLMNCHWIYRLLPSHSPRVRLFYSAFVNVLSKLRDLNICTLFTSGLSLSFLFFPLQDRTLSYNFMHISPEHSLLYLGPASRSCPHTYIYISPTLFTIIIRLNILAGLPFILNRVVDAIYSQLKLLWDGSSARLCSSRRCTRVVPLWFISPTTLRLVRGHNASRVPLSTTMMHYTLAL